MSQNLYDSIISSSLDFPSASSNYNMNVSDWLTISNTTGSSPAKDWYTVDWKVNTKNDPNEIWVPQISRYLQLDKIKIRSQKVCTNGILAMLHPDSRKKLSRLFVNLPEAVQELKRFRTTSSFEHKAFILLVNSIYAEPLSHVPSSL